MDFTHPPLIWNTDIDGSNLCVLTSSATDDWITINYVKVIYGCLAHPVISIVRSISIFSVASSFTTFKSAHNPKILFSFLPLFNPNIDLSQAVKVTKSVHHLSHDRASKGYWSIPGLTS